jgi:predicted nucleic acid-binding protein
MQPAVSDSDVIIHLAKLNELPLIKELYGCANIPEYVKSEIVRYKYKEAELIEVAIDQGILKVHKTSDMGAKKLAKRYGIHTGEGHVKVLAEKMKAGIFLSNEKKVRIAAKTEGFIVDGSIGVILRSVTQNLLTMKEATGLLEEVRGEEFRIHPDIINKAIDSCTGLSAHI